MLDVAGVAKYLLQRQLLSPRAVVDGNLRVLDSSRLNRVFLVTAEGERGYVVKVGGDGVEHEAAVLARLRSLGLAAWLPELVAYEGGVLVLEAAVGARDLTRHHRRGRFSIALAREVGRALGSLHRLPPTALADLPTAVDPGPRRGAHRPDLDELNTSSPAVLELIALVQRSGELCARLDELDATAGDAGLIHGDIRWDNCLAVPRSGRWTRLTLIDWEFAGRGDPAEDVGAFLGDYLGAWLRSIPDLNPYQRLDTLEHARYPLERMTPALRGFWQTYAEHRRRSAAELGHTLRRATQFAAVRLLTAALEEAQTLPAVSARALNAVNLSHAVLRRPDEAAAQLLGLDAPWAAA